MDPKKNSPNNNQKGGKNNKNLKGVLTLVAWAVVLTVALNLFSSRMNQASQHEITYSDFIAMVKADEVKEILFDSGFV